MSALDLIIEHAERVGELSVTKIDAARAELAQLRAQATVSKRRLEDLQACEKKIFR